MTTASRKAEGDMKCVIHVDRDAVLSIQVHWQDDNRRGTFHLCGECAQKTTLAALRAVLETRPGRRRVYTTLPPDELE